MDAPTAMAQNGPTNKAASMPRIDVISDVICPWCWIGKRQLELALDGAEARFDIHFRPFQLNPDMPEEGVPRAEYRAAKFGSVARGAELDAQVAEVGRSVGLRLRRRPGWLRGLRQGGAGCAVRGLRQRRDRRGAETPAHLAWRGRTVRRIRNRPPGHAA